MAYEPQPPHTHPHPHGHAHERREVIVAGGERGPGALVAVVVGLILVALVAWFLVSYFGGSRRSVDVNVPDRVQIDVNDGSRR